MKKIASILLISSFALTTWAADNKTSASIPAVKKSSSKICHTKESPSFNRVKKFEAYDSLKSCLDSGGKMPTKKSEA